MKKICVIGDSHSAALKRAWDRMYTGYPDIQVTFFAARGFAVGGMEIQGNRLVPNSERLRNSIEYTSGGMGYIDPEDYELFLVYGLGALANFENSQAFFSAQASNTAMADLVLGKPSFMMLNRLRKITGKPVYIGHYPLFAAEKVLREVEPVEYINGTLGINRAIYNPLDSGLIAQPLETIVNGNQTHPDYSKGSRRLPVGEGDDNESHASSDREHMNDDFGAIWLETFFRKLEAGH